MDDITKESSSLTTLKRQLNHGGEQDTNGGSADGEDSSPKRAKISDDVWVANHKAFPTESVPDSASLNGAITKPSPTDLETQEPPSHRTLTAGEEEDAVTYSGDMQAEKPATDSNTAATNSVINSRTSYEEHKDVSGQEGTEESCTGKTGVGGIDTSQDKFEEKKETVPSELATNREDKTETSNGTSISDSNSATNGPKKSIVLETAKEADVSCATISKTEEPSSKNGKAHPTESLPGAVRTKGSVPSVSRRKDNRPVSIREWSDNGLSRGEGEEEDDGDVSMGEEEEMEEGMTRRRLGQRVTRSRTRKEMGIEDPPPKSIYAELSDDSDVDESPPISPWVDPLSKLTPELLGQREKSTRLLREALRVEESKLLFLKKVKQNQQQPAPQPSGPTQPPTNLSQNRFEHHKLAVPMSAQLQQQQQANRARTSLGKPGYPATNQAGGHHQQRQGIPLLIRGTAPQGGRPGQTGPPPLMLVPGKQNSHNQMAPNRLQGHQVPRQQASKTSQQQVLQRQGIHVANQQVAHQRTNSAAQDGQSAASRQAAAKLALRKQLEKTLLQIPPPKPPPPELHFLPSAANSEFIILVGLEEVVNTILKIEESKKSPDSRESPKFLNPYRCSQCKTDFTTIWKQDPRKGIMCEACIVSNQKRALKAEHTNRLKTAFVKALQQEQEIEQRMQQSQQQQSKPAPPAHVVHQPPRSMYSMSSQQNIPSVRRVLNPPPVSQPQQRVPTSYQYIQHHIHQGGAATGQIPMLTKQQINSVYRMPTSDRQREYLLDMIPSKGLGQQTIVWKR